MSVSRERLCVESVERVSGVCREKEKQREGENGTGRAKKYRECLETKRDPEIKRVSRSRAIKRVQRDQDRSNRVITTDLHSDQDRSTER